MRIASAGRRLPANGAFSGYTAAWLHGLDAELRDPIEITVPPGCGVTGRVGMAVRRRTLETGDVTAVRGYRATSALRTLRDVCAELTLTEAVVIADMALHARLVSIASVTRLVETSGGSRGVRILRLALEHFEPASESPMESRLRMLLVLAGLPRPQAQVTIRDRLDRALGRPDLFYEDHRLGLEYDGAIHRTTLPQDNRRQNRLVEAGVRLLRFTAGDIYDTPELVVRAVRGALAG